MDLSAEAQSNIAGYRAFPFATLRVAMFGVPPFGSIAPFAPLISQRPPLAVAPTSANAFHSVGKRVALDMMVATEKKEQAKDAKQVLPDNLTGGKRES